MEDIVDIETPQTEILFEPPPVFCTKITKKKDILSKTEKKLRNNISSKKYREKCKQRIAHLKKTTKLLESENELLLKKIQTIEKENRKLLIIHKALKHNLYIHNPFSKK